MIWDKKKKEEIYSETNAEDINEAGSAEELDVTESENDSDELTVSEREELEQLRKERDERNLKEKAYDSLYDNLHLTVRGLNIFIALMVILFFYVVLKGMGAF
jgi:hypothetical protein